MDRVIKFRGKCSKKSKYKGEWVEGGLVVPRNIKDNEVLIISAHDVDCKFTCHVDKNTVGQFTGVYDIKGKEVYEGDILKVREYRNNAINLFSEDEVMQLTYEDVKGEMTKEWVGEAIYEESCFFVGDTLFCAFHGDKRFSFPIYEIEVIGNIFDNPELLKD